MKDFIPLGLRAPRNSLFLLLAVVLLVLIALVSPAQLPVALYKASLIALASVLGYWLDRVLFPYARPDGYLVRDWRYGTDEPEGDVDYPVVPAYARIYAATMMRRAVVVAAVVLGIASGL
ncbi:putative holin [Acidovorax sp. SUPP3334]|uniref:putative holin n=1 Tax=Acidovorax sp. SUPP3334 TaxID=2920881 RepID=UPI0023DE1B3C|nr:putative holin [Acidovorax sp. SUPP3334]GKT21682.1 putative holin [Acidovorax sp. SUPP3334]